jgi:hypothetical protein
MLPWWIISLAILLVVTIWRIAALRDELSQNFDSNNPFHVSQRKMCWATAIGSPVLLLLDLVASPIVITALHKW